MHAGRKYHIKEVLIWTRRELTIFLLYSLSITFLYDFFDFKWMGIPWVPIALVGTAVAFLIGFKNNVSYDRLWEARRIWGGIVNESRNWGLMARDFPGNKFLTDKLTPEQIRVISSRLIYNHLAWLTALRHQLREPRVWESMNEAHNIEYRKKFNVREYNISLEQELRELLRDAELKDILGKKNRATQIIAIQSQLINELTEKNIVDEFRLIEMQKTLRELLTLQGQCERIKNFPYPRQFATFNLYFVWIFIALLPFGMLQEFEKLGNCLVWLTVPFATLVSWVFHSMEKIGTATENPFEGSANDVPITALSRTIEIDLREMLNELNIPDAVKPQNNILL